MKEKQSLRIRALLAEKWALKTHIIDIQTHHCKLHDAITERAEKAESEVKKLKEALKKCSPMTVIAYIEIEEECTFCGAESENEHADDCEYVRLCGGAE